MLVLAILAVVVLLGIVFLAYFFVKLCRDSRKGNAFVFFEVLYGPAMARGFCRQDTHQPKLLSHRPADRDGEVHQGECQARPGVNVTREGWADVGGAPKATNNIVSTSFRYFVP
jgi:hypothetical protein